MFWGKLSYSIYLTKKLKNPEKAKIILKSWLYYKLKIIMIGFSAV